MMLDRDRSCEEDLNNLRPDVVCQWRPFACTGAHCCVVGASIMRCGVGTGCTAEPIAKFSREMRVVAKATGVGDLAERLACAQCPAMHQRRGVIQAKRKNEFNAGRAAGRKKLLEVTQQDHGDGRYLARAEIRVGEAVLDEAADTRKQLVRIA